MLAPFRRLTLVAVSPLLMLAIGCGDRDAAHTTSVAATVKVDSSVPTPPTGNPAPETVTPKIVAFNDAESVYQAGRYDEAAQLFNAYTERKPDNPWGFYMLGLSSWKAGNLAQADVAFGEALKLEPRHPKSLLNSARVLIELGRNDEALERVQAALAVDSTSAEAWRVMGRTQVELGKTEEAAASFRRAITLDDHDVWAMNNLALIYIQQGCPDQALAPLARATQIKPGSPVFQNNLGQALEATGHPAAAEQAYQAALSADSSYQKAAVALARVSARGEDSTEAPVDLAALARDFQSGVEQWRDAVVRDTGMARDSTPEVVTGSASEH